MKNKKRIKKIIIGIYGFGIFSVIGQEYDVRGNKKEPSTISTNQTDYENAAKAYNEGNLQSQTPTQNTTEPNNQEAPAMEPSSIDAQQRQADLNRQKKESEIYYSLARSYLTSGDKKKYAEYLEKAAASGNDIFSQKAGRELLKLKAQSPDLTLERSDSKDIRFLADGYENCHHDQFRTDCLEKMEEKTAYLSQKLFSLEEIQNRLRLAAMANTTGEYDKALVMLLPIAESRENHSAKIMGQVWLLLARALENSNRLGDLYSARKAYQKAVSFPDTREAAGFRLRGLNARLQGNFVQ